MDIYDFAGEKPSRLPWNILKWCEGHWLYHF